MSNLLLEEVEYQYESTASGQWRRYVFPTGMRFEEFVSHRRFFGLPLVHYTYGICPETGRRITAKGVIAVGRKAIGLIAIGQAALGIVAFGQAAGGVLLGLGQASCGILSVGQLAVGWLFGLGQIATGVTAIGQVAFGKYVLAQLGVGKYLWTPKIQHPEAVQFFKHLFAYFMS